MTKTHWMQATAAAVLLAATAGASAQTVLKIGYATTKESHYGVGSTVFCDEIAKGTANRYTCQQFPSSALGGERGGLRISGFDLGNSPREYTAERVAGQTVVITTTNGTAALHASRDAAEIVVGAIVNRRAVAEAVRRLAGDHGVVHLVCAGTDGVVSAEDVLAAGAILDAAAADGRDNALDDAARQALAFFRRVAARGDVPAALVVEFRGSPGGANLVDLGMEADLPAAAAIDSLAVVPRLDRASGSLI